MYRLQKGCPWLVSWGYQSIKFGHKRREPKRTGHDCDLSLRCRSSTPLGTSCSLSAWRKGWRVGPVERCEKGWSRGDVNGEKTSNFNFHIFSWMKMGSLDGNGGEQSLEIQLQREWFGNDMSAQDFCQWSWNYLLRRSSSVSKGCSNLILCNKWFNLTIFKDIL